MKKTEIINKAKSLVMVFAVILTVGSMAFLSSCGEDEEEPNLIVGTWAISSAVLNETTPFAVPSEITGAPADVQLPAGTDVTLLFGGIVANAGPCTNSANTAVQLTDDQKMLYVCVGETTAPDETGSWLVSQDGSTLTISIITEQGGSTVTVPLNLTDFTVTSTTLSGTIDDFSFFPGVNPPLNLQTVSMDVEFTRVP